MAIDLVAAKLQGAAAFGATHSLEAGRADLSAAVGEITGGRMLDYVFVTVGSAKAAEQAYSRTGKRGTVVLVGIPDFSATLPVPIAMAVIGEKRVVGNMMGSTRLAQDIRKLVSLYRSGRLLLDELISARFPLERLNEAIQSTESGFARRNVISFGV